MSFYSQNEMAVYFGLGQATSIDRLEIRWPSGQVQEWKDLRANQKMLATEGNPKLVSRLR